MRGLLRELRTVVRTPLLRNLLLGALIAALAFPLYVQFYNNPRFSDLLLSFTADDAERVAMHLGVVMTKSGVKLARSAIPPGFNEEVQQVVRDFHLEKLKLFAPDGETLYSTDPVDIGQRNTHEYFHMQVAKGHPFSKLVRKEGLTAEARKATADVVESYVPLMQGDQFLGAFEIYFDISARQATLDRLVAHATQILYGLSGLMMMGVLITLALVGRAQMSRHAAQMALHQSEARLRNMAASAQDAIIEIDARGIVNFWNQAAERIFGYQESEALGRNLHELIAPERFHGAYAVGFEHFVVKGEGHLIGKTTELLGRHKDGTEIPIEISIAGIADDRGERHEIGILRDISERKAAEQHLRLGSSVFTHAAQGITVTDAHANIQMVNPAFTKITGYSPEEVIGDNPRRLRSGRHDDNFYRQMWRSLVETGSWQGEIWNRHKNGELYPEWLSLSAIHDDHGRVTNYIGMFSDISHLKEVEQDLERLAFYDPLTTLPNRILFRERLQQAMKETDRNRGIDRVGLLYLDLDHFKEVNDIHGHEIGDRLLQEVANRIVPLVRGVDTVARLGGDEFVVVLGKLKYQFVACRIADRIIAAISVPFQLGEEHQVIQIGTSIGIAFYPDHAKDGNSLLGLADAAMYEAKTQGRNRYSIYAAPSETGNSGDRNEGISGIR